MKILAIAVAVCKGIQMSKYMCNLNLQNSKGRFCFTVWNLSN